MYKSSIYMYAFMAQLLIEKLLNIQRIYIEQMIFFAIQVIQTLTIKL